MTKFLTSRSRVADTLRCPRSRYWLHEANSTGFSPIRMAIPLVTGVSVHAGLADLCRTARDAEAAGLENCLSGYKFNDIEINSAVAEAVENYQDACQDRGLDIEALESQSFVFAEQRALVEALVRLAGLRVLPAILGTYEILEVEIPDQKQLAFQEASPIAEGWEIVWRSIPDALLRHRQSGDLYILSWKTCSSLPTEDDARIDMQGVSEAWALQGRLDTDWKTIRSGTNEEMTKFTPAYEGMLRDFPAPPKIRGVQMVHLLKGTRREASKEASEQILSADQISQGGRTKKTASPLIYGYSEDSIGSTKLAWNSMWNCSAPHPMRKSQWYPTGECPGDGRNHTRSGNWKSFPVWSGMGVREWMRMLDVGQVSPESGDCLDQQWSLPIPNFRTQDQMGNWLAQTRASEIRISKDLLQLRSLEEAEKKLENEFQQALNSSVLGPQSTEKCNQWFGRKCPAWELCWGPEHIATDPLSSGLYQIKEQYKAEVLVEEA